MPRIVFMPLMIVSDTVWYVCRPAGILLFSGIKNLNPDVDINLEFVIPDRGKIALFVLGVGTHRELRWR